jgi:hypothetical protein
MLFANRSDEETLLLEAWKRRHGEEAYRPPSECAGPTNAQPAPSLEATAGAGDRRCFT